MPLSVRTFGAMFTSIVKPYTIAFILIVPIIIFLIGDLKIGLLSMSPNLTPIILALDMMPLFNLPLDILMILVGRNRERRGVFQIEPGSVLLAALLCDAIDFVLHGLIAIGSRSELDGASDAGSAHGMNVFQRGFQCRKNLIVFPRHVGAVGMSLHFESRCRKGVHCLGYVGGKRNADPYGNNAKVCNNFHRTYRWGGYVDSLRCKVRR